MPDDAWIYFRYADHLVDGHGWVYNLTGATGNAATSPLHVLLLAGLHVVGVPLIAAARILAAAGLFVAMLFARSIYMRAGRPLAGWVFAFLLATAPVGLLAGVEGTTYIALIMGAIQAAHGRRYAAAGLLLAAVAAARGEGAVLAVIVVAMVWWDEGAMPKRMIAAGAAAGMVWLGFLALVVKEVLPLTMHAKLAQGQTGLWPGFWDGFWSLLARRPVWAIAVGLSAVAGMATLQRRMRLPMVAILGLGAATAGLHEVSGVAFYQWYATALVVATLFAAAWFAGASPAHAVAVGVLITSVATLMAHPRSGPVAYRQPLATYREAGNWLAVNAPRDAAVAATEIGVIGWHSQRCIVDYLGLLDPEAAERLAEGNLSWWVGQYQPEYVVTSSLELLEAPARRASSSYMTVWQSGEVAILERTVPVAGRRGLCTE